MNKEIEVIDLLNKIANGEEVPKKIKYKDFEYIYAKEIGWYRRIDDIGTYDEWFINKNRLHDIVEIIEEQEEIDIQELKEYEFPGYVDIKLSPIEKKLLELINQNRQAVKKLDKDINYIDN